MIELPAPSGIDAEAAIPRAVNPGPCMTCGQSPPSALEMLGGSVGVAPGVYVVGRLEARFPNLGVEKEYVQLTDGDPQALIQTTDLKNIVSDISNRYLARQLVWVFTAHLSEACTIIPRDNLDLDLLVETLAPDGEDLIQVLIGSAAPAQWRPAISGLPEVFPEQILSFRTDEFVEALPAANERVPRDKSYRSVVTGLFSQLTRRANNMGVEDAHRAYNYLALRYPPIYHLTWRQHSDGKALVDIQGSHRHVGDRRLAAVRFSFRDRQTHIVDRFLVEVDVTDVFPFLATPVTTIYD